MQSITILMQTLTELLSVWTIPKNLSYLEVLWTVRLVPSILNRRLDRLWEKLVTLVLTTTKQQHHHIKRLLPKSKRTIRASKQIMAHLATKTKGIMRKVVTLLGWSSPLTLMGWSGLMILKDLVESTALLGWSFLMMMKEIRRSFPMMMQETTLLGWSFPMMMKEIRRSFPMMNGNLLLDLTESTLTLLSKNQNQFK